MCENKWCWISNEYSLKMWKKWNDKVSLLKSEYEKVRKWVCVVENDCWERERVRLVHKWVDLNVLFDEFFTFNNELKCFSLTLHFCLFAPLHFLHMWLCWLFDSVWSHQFNYWKQLKIQIQFKHTKERHYLIWLIFIEDRNTKTNKQKNE
jgi:hypothetical protein